MAATLLFAVSLLTQQQSGVPGHPVTNPPVHQEVTKKITLPPGVTIRALERQSPITNDPTFAKIKPRIVALVDRDNVLGYAAMISRDGLFMGERIEGDRGEIDGRFMDGSTCHLRIIGKDGCAQLVLWQADSAPKGVETVAFPTAELNPGTPLVVVVDGGTVGARLEAKDRLGVVQPSRRLLPLYELRLETPTTSLKGALVFDDNGAFVGVLSATLSHTQAQFQNQSTQDSASAFGAPGGFGGGFVLKNSLNLNNYPGPGSLTVAYSPSTEVFRRAVTGFLSPTHVVEHASLGIYCNDGFGGAFVTSVADGSAAAKAGLRATDVIHEIGGQPIRSQIDFARFIFQQQPGDKVTIRVDRNGKSVLLSAVLGSVTD